MVRYAGGGGVYDSQIISRVPGWTLLPVTRVPPSAWWCDSRLPVTFPGEPGGGDQLTCGVGPTDPTPSPGPGDCLVPGDPSCPLPGRSPHWLFVPSDLTSPGWCCYGDLSHLVIYFFPDFDLGDVVGELPGVPNLPDSTVITDWWWWLVFMRPVDSGAVIPGCRFAHHDTFTIHTTEVVFRPTFGDTPHQWWALFPIPADVTDPGDPQADVDVAVGRFPHFTV